MTRVLCLTSWYPPHHFGGYETSCHDVMVRLAERGHHVEVLTSDHRHRGVDDGTPAPVAAVYRDLQLYFRDGQLWSPPLAGRYRVERANQQALRRALAAARPDVVAVWHVGAMSLGLLTTLVREGRPIVYSVSDDWPAYVRQLDPWIRAMGRVRGLGQLAELVLRTPATVPDLDTSGVFCFISEVTRERCRRSSPWSFPRSTIVYSGIDTRRFELDARRAPSSGRSPERALQLLYVGRIDERKGLRTILQSLAGLPGATLVVDGRAEPADRRRLDEWAQEAGVADRVRVQTSDRSALADVYRAAGLCVFASEWEEPFGLVPLEAMACGTPVVATGVGGSAEFLIDGANCVRFEAGDAGSLAAAVRRVAGDAELRARLVRNGFVTAEHFDVDHLADAFEAWYTAAAKGFPEWELPPDRPALRLAAG